MFGRWSSATSRGIGRTLVNVIPDVARGSVRAFQEAIVQPALNLYDVAGYSLLDSELDDYKKALVLIICRFKIK